jgi:protein AFG1
MHKAKMIQKIKGDVLPHIIQNVILPQGKIICFDEFQVTDVADALILRRLFTGLLQNGAVIVATSNRPPCDLYLNGLQRDLFLPFIDLLERKLDVVSMWESEVDYRLVQGENKARGVYFIGNGESDDDNDVNNAGTSGGGGGGGENKKDFEKVFHDLTKGSTISSTTLLTQGRQVKIPKVAAKYNIARFSFNDLCREARGAADYLIIGDTYHTIFVEDVPQLTMNDVNLVRRFIIFVDSMYECHVKLIIHAATGPNEIFKVDLGNEFCDEAFAFDRTRSRLEEMGSDEYLKRSWVGSSSNSGSNSSLIEKSQSSNKK